MGIVMLQEEGERARALLNKLFACLLTSLDRPSLLRLGTSQRCSGAHERQVLSFKSTSLKSSRNPPRDHKKRIDSKANL